MSILIAYMYTYSTVLDNAFEHMTVNSCFCFVPIGLYTPARVYDREESIERRHTVHQMYTESNVTPVSVTICTDQSKCG